MGLNFDTMRYNGKSSMGNRFRQLDGYKALVTGHAVLAAITFLAIVPAAILTASFYHRNPYAALRIHISLQIFTVILTTVIFVLGYFQVGPERSLTNPHHGIGLTLFLLVLVQAFGGWIIHRLERNKVRYYIPIRLMLHQWLGRGIALLGFAQIPIGLTLYGSPQILFILYALWMFALLVLYFILVHRNHKRVALGIEQDERESYVSAPHTEISEYQQDTGPQRRRRRLEEAAGAVGLGAALTALRRRSSGRRRAPDDYSDAASTVPPSQAPTASRVTEKFTDSEYSSEPRRRTWRDRLLGPGIALGGLGGLAAGRRLFQRRRERDDISDEGTEYAPPPLGGHVSQSSLDRLEAGGSSLPPAPPPNDRWRSVEERERAQEAALRRGEAQSRLSDESYSSLGPEKPRPRSSRFNFPASLGALATAGGIGSFFKRRRERREDDRIAAERAQEHENERLYTSPGGRPRFTADGTPRRTGHFSGPPTPITERTESPERSRIGVSNTGSPVHRSRRASHASTMEPYSPSAGRGPRVPIPPPPQSRAGSRPRTAQSHNVSPSIAHSSPGRQHRVITDSVSNLNTTTNVVDHGPAVDTPAAATATSGILSPPHPPYAHGRSRSQSGSPQDSNESPVASVKVRMGNDGRHVTLRRLNEDEAARERAARRSEGRRDDGHFRRAQTPAASQQPSPLSLPPQQTPGVSPPSALGAASQGTQAYDTGTDVTDFENNRRRRRAERARADQTRAARRTGGGTVAFDTYKQAAPVNHARRSKRATITEALGNAQELYFANVSVGSTGQLLQLQIDTGSSDVWMTDVHADYCQENGGCQGGAFDPSRSSSYHVVDQGGFSIQYVDNSYSQGDYFTDDITVGGVTINGQEMGLATDTSIGTGILGVGFTADESICAQNQASPSSGSGRCRTYPSIIDSMVNQSKINTPAYSLWLNDLEANTGSILFGGVDTAQYSGDLVTLPILRDEDSASFTSFSVAWTGFSIGTPKGEETNFVPANFAYQAILDSGTSIALFPDDLANQLYTQYGAQYSGEIGAYVAPCYLQTANATLDFQFGGAGGPTIRVPVSEFLLDLTKQGLPYAPKFSNGHTACMLGFQAAQGQPILLGDTFLRSAYVVYDLDNREISIAETVFNSSSSNVQEIQPGPKGVPNVASTASAASISATATGRQGINVAATSTFAGAAGTATFGANGEPPLAAFTTASSGAAITAPTGSYESMTLMSLVSIFAVIGASLVWV
ncbi:MAG: hypothetical protein Q9162_007476 [Coniocarpon cinnabarinum]